MTFSTYEESAQDGSAVELYTFYAGTQRLDFTSGDVAVVYQTRTYAPAALQRTAIDDTAEISKSEIRLTCAHDFDIAQWFNPYPPSDIIRLELRRMHRGDTEAPLFWTGRVLSCRYTGITAELQCESLLSSMRRPGLRRLYQRTCPHSLYGAKCGVASASFKVAGTISSVDGNEVTIAAAAGYANGYFSGGFLEWNNGTRTEKRGISNHVGDTLELSHPVPGLAFGENVFLYAGCDHTLATCDSKFDNALNYGGFPYVPTKNPFGQNSVF